MSDIPINPVTRRVQFTGNTGLGPFAFTFNIYVASDIAVYRNAVLLTLTTDYTVTIAANGTGSVTLTGSGSGTTLTVSDSLTIVGARQLARTTDFVTAGDLLAVSLNEQLDSNVIMSQQLDEKIDRSIKFDQFDTYTTATLPAAAARADKIIKFDVDGELGVASAADFFGNAVLGANYVTNTATGTGSQVAFGLTVSPGSKNNVQVYIDGVYQNKASFSISAATITFSEAPPLNSAIEFIIGQAVTEISGDSDSINYTQGGTGSQQRTLTSKLQESVSVKDFGAVGDGVTDDTAAIQAAIDAVNAIGNGSVVFSPSAQYKCNALTIDPTTTGIVGNGATLNFTSMTTGNAFSILPVTASGTRNQKTFVHSISGLLCNGPGLAVTAVVAVNINDTSGSNLNSGLVFRDCSFVNFAKDVIFGNGAFCTLFDHCNFTITGGTATTYSINVPSTSSNAGERNVFSNCMWNNRDKVCLHENSNGNTFFTSCSFDYSATNVMQISAGSVTITTSHIEQSSDADYWFAVSGAQSQLAILDSEIHIQAAKPNFSPLYCDATSTQMGIVLDNVRVVGNNPVTQNIFVAGTGHTIIRNLSQPTSIGTNLASASQNQLAYGDFEDANYTADWTLSSGAIRSSAASHAGTHSLSFPASSGVTPRGITTWPCNSTQRFAASLWYYVPAITGTGGTFYIMHSFLDNAGNALSGSDDLIQTTNVGSWTKLRISPQVVPPVGTVNVSITVDLFGVTSGTPVGYIDDVIVNVC
jgi:hypothetical protein